MIIKFKPSDFEECLMGLPLENWQFVDDSLYNLETPYLRSVARPKMMISHLKELKGIVNAESAVRIRGYTPFETIFNSDDVPEYFKAVVKQGVSKAMTQHHTLGCYMSSYLFDRYLFPVLVATRSSFLLKSYMQERLIVFDQFTLSGRLQFANYNEIPYELILEKRDYSNYAFDTVDFEELSGDTRFSYFLGVKVSAGLIESFDFAIMLPSKAVVYLSDCREILLGQAVVDILQFKNDIYNKCYDGAVNFRLHSKYKYRAKMIFEKVVWNTILDVVGEA